MARHTRRFGKIAALAVVGAVAITVFSNGVAQAARSATATARLEQVRERLINLIGQLPASPRNPVLRPGGPGRGRSRS